jgi:RecA-family ATPase
MSTEFAEPNWAIPGLICEGLNLLGGPPKLGKSWFALDMAVKIANGDKVLGCIDTEPGPVLYLALEDTGRRLQARRTVQLDAGGKPAPNVTYVTECPPMGQGGEQVLTDWLLENPDAKLVVIDTFQKIRGNPTIAGSSAYADDYAAAARIKKIADDFAVAIVLVHHVRKQGHEDWQSTVSGTNGLTGAMDAILVLERARGEAEAILHVTGRDVPEADYAMRFDAGSGTWEKLDGPVEQHSMANTRLSISKFVYDKPGQTPRDIAMALGEDVGKVRTTLSRMVQAGQVRRAGDGTYLPPNATG